MADKEVTVKVTTETDLAPLEELDSAIEDLQSKAEEMEVDVEVEDSSVEEAIDKTGELEDELGNVDDTVVTPEVDTSSIDDAKDKLEETTSSMDNLTTAAAGIGAAAGFEQMAVTADNINTSWNRLDLTFSGTGVSMDTLRDKASALSDSTGRSGGVIRDYFNQMGIAGVTNTELLSSSFEALAGKAYQTGNDIGAMESKLYTMVLSGNASNRMLKSLGLSAEDLASVMGVSADKVNEAFKNMTPEERLQAITKAMGDGKRANEMYKNSYEGLKTQAQAAMAGLMGAVGQAVLPVIVPALQAATNIIKTLTAGFKALPGPVQAIIGGIGGFAAVVTAAVGVLGILGNVITTVKTGLTALRSITLLSEIATKAAAAAQWLLNIAMDANPIMIVVLAIIALIAVLGYLYFNNEQVRAAIDGLGQTIMYVAGVIWDTLVAAFNALAQMFEEFTSSLGLNTSNWAEAILGFILFLPMLPLKVAEALVNAIANAMGFQGNFTQTMINAAVTSVTGFITYVASLPGKLGNQLSNAINRAANFAASFAQNMLNAGVRSVSNFISQISQMPGKLLNELNRMLSYVSSWAATLPAKFWQAGVNAVKNFLSALGINSPGTMQRMMIWEVSEMGRRIPEESQTLIGNIRRMGDSVVDAFDPSLSMDGVSFANGSITGDGRNGVAGQVNNFYFSDVVVDDDKRMQKIVEYVTRELAWDNATAGRTN